MESTQDLGIVTFNSCLVYITDGILLAGQTFDWQVTSQAFLGATVFATQNYTAYM